MCLIALALNVHPAHPLLMVANRDEFHARPAAPLAWWPDAPALLAGRDLQGQGTWLGVSRSGRVAAVTNVRGADAAIRLPRSRGALVTAFLAGTASAAAYADALREHAAEFGGFNLLLYDGTELRYVSNRPAFSARAVDAGVHALSNAQLDTPWPKAVAAQRAMQAWLARDLDDEAALLAAMGDPAQAPDAQLPQTGVGLEMERLLSAAHIRTPTYGTRCTSLLRLSRVDADVFERRYDTQGRVAGQTREQFTLVRM